MSGRHFGRQTGSLADHFIQVKWDDGSRACNSGTATSFIYFRAFDLSIAVRILRFLQTEQKMLQE